MLIFPLSKVDLCAYTARNELAVTTAATLDAVEMSDFAYARVISSSLVYFVPAA